MEVYVTFLFPYFYRNLDRKIGAVAPLLPGTNIVADFWVANQSESQVRVSRSITALTVTDNLFVGRNSHCLIHLL